jgi:hypothetical protein
LTWLAKAYAYHHLTDSEKAASLSKKPQGVSYGIGLAFALFVMQGSLGFMSKLWIDLTNSLYRGSQLGMTLTSDYGSRH